MPIQKPTVLLTVAFAPIGKLSGGSIALLKGKIDGVDDYALLIEPGTPQQEYLGSLSEDDNSDDRSAVLGALTKIRLLLEEMSK